MATSPRKQAKDALAKAKATSKRVLTKAEAFRKWADRPDSAAISELVSHVLEGGSLNAFCKKKGFAYTTVSDWIAADAAGRAVKYAQAREDRSDFYAERIAVIADQDCSVPIMGEDAEGRPIKLGAKVDPGRVQQLKLQSDNLKWVASKLKPRTYGDKLELGGKVDLSGASDADLAKELAQFGLGAIAVQALGLKPQDTEGSNAVH